MNQPSHKHVKTFDILNGSTFLKLILRYIVNSDKTKYRKSPIDYLCSLYYHNSSQGAKYGLPYWEIVKQLNGKVVLKQIIILINLHL